MFKAKKPEIKKSKKPVLQVPKVLAVPTPKIEEVAGPKCDCGKPVAEGQTEVCKEHIRRG